MSKLLLVTTMLAMFAAGVLTGAGYAQRHLQPTIIVLDEQGIKTTQLTTALKTQIERGK